MSVYELETIRRSEGCAPAAARAPREAPLLAAYGWTLRRFRLWVLGGALAGAAAGWLGPALADPYWEARSLLEIPAPNRGFLSLDEVNPSAEQSASLRTRLRTQERLLESRAAADRAVERLSAAEPQLAADWRRAADSVAVSAMDDSRILELRGEGSSRRGAQTYLETLIAVHLEGSHELRSSEASATEEWFDVRLAELETRLRNSEIELQQAARLATLIPASADRRSAAEADLRRMEERLGEAQNASLELQARLEAGVGAVGPDDPLASHRRELEALTRRRAELAAIYTPEHHLRRQVEAEFGAVETSFSAEAERIRTELEASLAETRRRIVLLEQERDRRLELLSEAAAAAVRFDILERQVAANRDLYQTFLEARRKAAVAALSPTPQLRVVDPPLAGEEPAGPNPPLGALAGLLVGFGAAFAGALIRERLDQTFRQPGDLHSALAIRELAAIPDARYEPARRNLTSADGAASPGEWRPELAAGRPGPSLLAESFRSMRTSLLDEVSGSSIGRVWAVTSPSESDGKTTVAANLALSMAELGRRVLLVDADLRRPRLHRIFEAVNRAGLSDLLGAEPPSEAEIDAAIETMPGSERLHLLPSGVAAYGGPGLLHSAALNALLARLRDKFDLVVVDTPPALAVSDARALARSADGVVLVVRAGRTGAALAAEAEALLRSDGARVLGAVLNSWDPRQGGRRGYWAYMNGPQAA